MKQSFNAVLDQAYATVMSRPPTDPIRQAAASISPLALALHFHYEQGFRPLAHARLIDHYLYSFLNLTLYPAGPGPAPEVYGRKQEGEGEFVYLGTGYQAATSHETAHFEERALIRPGVLPPVELGESVAEDLLSSVGSPDRVALRLAINTPPRAGKSSLVTEALPLIFLLRHPTNAVLVATYSGDFAQTWGLNLQQLLADKGDTLPTASDGYPLSAIHSTQSATQFRAGKDTGVVYFRGVGGVLTGTGYGLGIVDDAIKDAEEGNSPTILAKKAEWYSSVFTTRKTSQPGAPPPLEVHIQTRWNEQDLSGRFAYEEDGVTPKPGWATLNLPAISEGADDPLGREPGRSIAPSLLPLSFLQQQREMDPVVFSCLYQGRPSLADGELFKRTAVTGTGQKAYHHWQYRASDHSFIHAYDSERAPVPAGPNQGTLHFLTMDLAVSKRQTADYTVVSRWLYHTSSRTLVLLDSEKDRITNIDYQRFLYAFIQRDPAADGPPVVELPPLAFVGIENKTFGTSLINELRQDTTLVKTPVIPLDADADKVTRAVPYASAVGAGRVWFPRPDLNAWVVGWENEHAKFPRVRHDDQVDTGSMAYTKTLDYAHVPGHDPRPHDGPEPGSPAWHIAKMRKMHERANPRQLGGHDYHRLAQIMEEFAPAAE